VVLDVDVLGVADDAVLDLLEVVGLLADVAWDADRPDAQPR
jgi:hypothetical protein